MADVTLSLTYPDFLVVVAEMLGYDPDNLTAAQLGLCDRRVQSAYRQFLSPQPLRADGDSHEWSFLSPVATLVTVDETLDYDAPDDFGGIIGDYMSYVATATSWRYPQVPIVGEARIRSERARQQRSGYPKFIAVRPKANDGTEGQRWEFMIWPDPDDAYTLVYRYNRQRNALTTEAPYPLGGAQYGELIAELCRAEVERIDMQQAGVHAGESQRRLLTAISRDLSGSVVGNLGRCTDPSSRVRAPLVSRAEGVSLTVDEVVIL